MAADENLEEKEWDYPSASDEDGEDEDEFSLGYDGVARSRSNQSYGYSNESDDEDELDESDRGGEFSRNRFGGGVRGYFSQMGSCHVGPGLNDHHGAGDDDDSSGMN